MSKYTLDELSFEKAELPQNPPIDVWHSFYKPDLLPDTAAYAKVLINNRSYIDIMEPYLRECADRGLYIYKREGFWYLTAEELFKELEETIEGKRKYIDLLDVYYVYDACQPLRAKVIELKTIVKWQIDSMYRRWWKLGELPVFRFDKEQYIAALSELKTIVNSHTDEEE